ncbi:phage capsid protein [Cohaesibacter gelatinilyticus]|nr:phage capsid protein [Cohaesibacter gelatinilyticus]
MSNDVPNWFKTQYNDKVRQKFQAKGFMMKSTVTSETKIEGSKAIFRIMGKSQAHKKKRGQAARKNNSQKKTVEAHLETWEFFDTCETYDVSRMGPGEKENLTTSGAMALGRGVDHAIFDAGDKLSSTNAGTGAGVKPLLDADGRPGMIGGNNKDFVLDLLLMMNTALQNADVPWDGNVYCPLPSLIWNQCLAYKQFNNADWTGDQLSFLRNTVSKFWGGVHYFLAPDEYFTEVEEGHYDFNMWHKEAMGWSNNKDLQTIWDWENDFGHHSIRMEVEGAEAGLMEEGIVRCRVKIPTEITLQ